MNTVDFSKRDLELVVRKSVRQELAKELASFRGAFLSFVSEKEQRDIERRYGGPSRKVAKTRKLEL